jgi:hypothetical protein
MSRLSEKTTGMGEAARRGSLARRLRRCLRAVLTRPLLAVASATVPALYVAYMWIVWLTSQVEDCGFGTLPAVRDQYGGFVGMPWHEEYSR